MKNCLFCAEKIKNDAIKCKHCKSMLNESTESVKTNTEPDYEYKVLKVEEDLDLYIEKLPFFGWEIQSNQKINYKTESTGKSEWSPWFLDKNKINSKWSSSDTHFFYNELSLRRDKNKINLKIASREEDFFNFYNHYSFYSRSVENDKFKISSLLLGMFILLIVYFILWLFFDNDYITMFITWILTILWLIGWSSNYKSSKENRDWYFKKYTEVINEIWIE